MNDLASMFAQPAPQGGGQDLSSSLVQQAQVKEMFARNDQEAQALIEQLRQQGYQAYALPGSVQGERPVRFWPLNEPPRQSFGPAPGGRI
jgi:hypothetical protein